MQNDSGRYQQERSRFDTEYLHDRSISIRYDTIRYQTTIAVRRPKLRRTARRGVRVQTCLDTERRACPQSAAFFSRRTRITPSTYVFTSFVSDLVLAKSVAVGKTPRETLLSVDRLLYNILAAYCVEYVAIIIKSSSLVPKPRPAFRRY